MSALMEFRSKYKEEILKKTGVKLGFMSAFSRASVLAMRDIPAVNASIEGPNGGDTIVYRDYVDISVAVATEKGMVTPVVRNAESLDMIGIEKAIADMGKKVQLYFAQSLPDKPSLWTWNSIADIHSSPF
jgi:2-oxoglutarate dehydrogenase E2 component (dihydrolipoamide succinyltransferase)